MGRIERTLFTLEWLQNPEPGRRVNAAKTESEAKNALARAVFFNRFGELRDRSFEDQRYRASGLNLAVAAIIAWNTVYLERAAASLAEQKAEIQPELLAHLSPRLKPWAMVYSRFAAKVRSSGEPPDSLKPR